MDVGGYGGTNFAKIENKRRDRLLHIFNDWGIPTAVSIVEAKNSGCRWMSLVQAGFKQVLILLNRLR